METFVAWAQILAAIGTLSLATLTFFYVLATRAVARSNQKMVEDMQEAREAEERPHVIVDADYTSAHTIEVVVRNIGKGSAKNITFNFSEDLENSKGSNISELPYFENGMDFLAPGSEIRAFWDMDFNLMPLLEKRGLHQGITITSSYESTRGKSYTTVWIINPLLFRNQPELRRYGIHEIAKATTKIADNFNKAMRFGELKVSTKEERRLQQERMLAEEEKMIAEDDTNDSQEHTMESKDESVNLVHAVYSKTAEAYELAEQLEQAAQNTSNIDQARKIAADLNRMMGEISGLRHKLINSEE